MNFSLLYFTMKGMNFTTYFKNLTFNSNVSDNILIPTEDENTVKKWFDLSTKLRFYFTIILVATGITCNFLTIAVFSRPSLRKSFWYLMMLAVADNCVLIAEGRSHCYIFQMD